MVTTPNDLNEFSDDWTQDSAEEADKNLETLKDHLLRTEEHTKDLPIHEALEWTEDYLRREGIPVPAKLSQFLIEVRGNDEVAEPFRGTELKLRSEVGAWGNLLAADAFNLLIAAPKAGKSALIVHVFACSKRGDETCLGLPIRKRWNKLIISGNDMSVGEWGKILIREGLAVPTGDDHENFLPDDDVIIWDTGNPARMNAKGIKAMAEQCALFPDSLLVIDSLRSNTDASIDENKAEIREPIEQTKKGLDGCKVTTVLIHHANKSVAGGTAITASAGNNAIPGSCDNTLLLKHLKPEPVSGYRTDNRLVATSSGRLQSDHLLIELTSTGIGAWESRGDAEQALRAEHIAEVEERLQGRLLLTFEHAEEIADNGVHTTTAEIAQQLNITQIKARKALEALCRKGLMVRCGSLDGGFGRPQILYAPATSNLALAGEAVGGVKGVTRVLSQGDTALETLDTLKTPFNSILTRGREEGLETLADRVHQQFPEGCTVERADKGGIWVVTSSYDPSKIRIEKFGNKTLVSHVSHTLLRHANALSAASDSGSTVSGGESPLLVHGSVHSVLGDEDPVSRHDGPQEETDRGDEESVGTQGQLCTPGIGGVPDF